MESNLQSKLQAYSAPPPAGVWNKIADALDADEAFSHRLYQYEEPPPAALWAKLETALEEEPQIAKVVTGNSFKKFFRYGAVACFIAVILVTVTLTVRRTEAGALQAGSNSTVPTSTDPSAAAAAKKQNAVAQKNKMSSATNNTRAYPIAAAEEDHPTNISRPSLASFNEYVSFRDGDGKLRRVAKKLAAFVNCNDGDEACQQRLQQLRQTMAINATTTDFTGVLEMLHGLQQKP